MLFRCCTTKVTFRSSFIFSFLFSFSKRILSTISVYAPLTSVDFHPNGSLVAVGTMGQNASVYDLRDPKTKIAHLVNSDHKNVYSVRFDMGQSTTLQRPTTLTQEVSLYLNYFIYFISICRQIKG
jgi:WD40 repeat protein